MITTCEFVKVDGKRYLAASITKAPDGTTNRVEHEAPDWATQSKCRARSRPVPEPQADVSAPHNEENKS